MSATKIGIWMDHQHAVVTEFTTDPMKDVMISNDGINVGKHKDFSKGENHLHTKEQHRQSDYYRKLSDIIKRYTNVMLFGPTSAKDELFNRLSSDPAFSGIKIIKKDADKMTDNQRHAFIHDYFSKHHA